MYCLFPKRMNAKKQDHIYNLKENLTSSLSYDIGNRLMDKGRGEERESEINGQSSMDAYILARVNREPVGICCTIQGTQTGAL